MILLKLNGSRVIFPLLTKRYIIPFFKTCNKIISFFTLMYKKTKYIDQLKPYQTKKVYNNLSPLNILHCIIMIIEAQATSNLIFAIDRI